MASTTHFALRRMLFVSVALVASGFAPGSAFAAPPKPLIVLFTPGVPAGPRPVNDDDTNLIRARRAVTAVRDRFNESGYVDAVVYSPDAALFVRAAQEAKLKLGDPTQPTASECYTLAKAAGAGYSAFVVSGLPNATTSGAVDIELQTEQIEGRKVWRGRRNAGGSTTTGADQSDNALASAANTLVEDFLRGPLRDLAQGTAPSLPPPQPIPTVRTTPETSLPATDNTTPNLAVPVPMTAPRPSVSPAERGAALPSSGADTDNAAEAERHQGDEQMRAGDVQGAILSYRKAVNLSPMNPTYRTTLASAYLQAGRKGDALSETKRALDVLPGDDHKGRLAATRLLADILVQNGDTTAARTTYENILQAKPTATWAKVGLAETLVTDGKVDEALALYKSARIDAPTDKDVMLGYARLLATKGDYDEALKQLTAASENGDGDARYRTALQLFDEGVAKIAERVEQNRSAWEKKQITQPVFYKATAAQSAKVSGLVSLLKAVPPPATADENTKRKHQKRVFAASLLLQGVASLLTQVETGDANAASEATVFLTEFGREMTEITGVRRSSRQ